MNLEKEVQKECQYENIFCMIYSAMAEYIIFLIIIFIMNLCRAIQPIIQFLVKGIYQFFRSVCRGIENHTSKYKGVDE